MIYLDYAANSPVDKDVLDIFYDVSLKYYANPNSTHKLGLEAKNLLDKCTENIARNFDILPEEIIYTSGATEANNLVVKGICDRYKSRGKHIIIGSLEHNSILAPLTVLQEQGFEVELAKIDRNGLIDIDSLEKMIRGDTILVSICSVDSELGIRQPIEKIASIVKNYTNCYFHTDASQAIGKVNIDFSDVDLITVAPHKFYGMNGFGMLIKKKHVGLKPIINGGKSTTIYRSGTPVLASVVALSKSLDIALSNQNSRYNYVSKLNKIIVDKLSEYDDIHINSNNNSICYIINFSIKSIKSSKLVDKLQEHEIYVSSKTSCCPTETPSKLVYALTLDKALASTSVRISLSHITTLDEVNEFLRVFDICYRELIDGEV